MLSITRRKRGAEIVFVTHGALDVFAVNALLYALSRTPDRFSIRIDLSRAETPAPEELRQVAAALRRRSGLVRFTGPAWAPELPKVRE